MASRGWIVDMGLAILVSLIIIFLTVFAFVVAVQGDRLPPLPRSFDAGRAWLMFALTVSLVVFAVYYLTHPYPAYGAGLFLAMADQIQANGYRFPTTIPHYTHGGVPFAYPPLLFYVIGVLLDIGADPLLLTRILPGVVTILYLVPFYALARELLDSEHTAGLATVIVAVTPTVLWWHLSAGGIIRAPAYLLMLTGLYCGVRLFKTGDRQWFVSSIVLFGLTVLSHPTYTAFFGVSYLFLYASYDRSLLGLSKGATVAVGGLLLATPWWAHVLRNYSLETFTGAAATHKGLVYGPMLIVSRLVDPLFLGTAISLWYFLMLAGIAISLWRRQFILPAWFILGMAVMNELRFPLVPGVMLAAVALSSPLTCYKNIDMNDERLRTIVRWSARGTVAVVISFMIIAGGAYAAGTMIGGGPTMIAFIDDDDRAAMQWVQTETPSDARFVVLGDAGEWFPYLTDRTMLVGRWGVEWVSASKYRKQLTQFWELSVCHTEQCLTSTLHRHDVHPDYVYVPTDEYSALSAVQHQPPSMRQSLIASEKYKLMHENDGVAVFRVVNDHPKPPKKTNRSPTTSTHKTELRTQTRNHPQLRGVRSV